MSEKEVPSRQIKNFLINPRAQITLVAIFCGVVLFTIITLYFASLIFIWRFKDTALSIGIPEGHVFFRFLAEQKSYMDLLFFSVAFLNLLIVMLIGIVVSHRIAGPIERLKKHLTTIESESDNFKIRKHDFFREICVVVDKLRGRLKP